MISTSDAALSLAAPLRKHTDRLKRLFRSHHELPCRVVSATVFIHHQKAARSTFHRHVPSGDKLAVNGSMKRTCRIACTMPSTRVITNRRTILAKCAATKKHHAESVSKSFGSDVVCAERDEHEG
jgi:hypothetical protein